MVLSKWFRNQFATTLVHSNTQDKNIKHRQPPNNIVLTKHKFMSGEGIPSATFRTCCRVPFPLFFGKPAPLKFDISSISSSIQRNQLWPFRPFQTQLRLPLNLQSRPRELQHKPDSSPKLSLMQMLLILNGVYDIFCACCILWFKSVPWLSYLSDLHPSMFEKVEHGQHPVIRRLISYWLITYGTARIATGLHKSPVLGILGASTYFIEALCYLYELRVGETMIPYKVMFVSTLCIVLGILVLFRSLPSKTKDASNEVAVV